MTSVQDNTVRHARARPAPPRLVAHLLGAAVLAVMCASCHDGGTTTGTGEPQPGLRLVSGASATDTIEAVVSKPLVVEFRDDTGQLLANRIVTFNVYTTLADGSGQIAGGVTLTIGSANFDGTSPFQALTDADGRVTAQVRLGKNPGQVVMFVGVPNTRLSASANYVIRAGAPARVTLQPRDTAVYPAARLVLRQTSQDRYGHPTTGTVPVTYTASPGLTVSSGGIATPRDPGRAFIIAHSGSYTDSIALTVLPFTGTIAASLPPTDAAVHGVAIMNLDGTGYKEYAKNLGPGVAFSTMVPRWTYDGKSLIVRVPLLSDTRLWTVPLDATAPHRFLVAPTFTSEYGPAPSPDGQWVYYCTGTSASPNFTLAYRARLDGTGIQMLPLVTPPLGEEYFCATPEVSADGTWLAWTVPGDGRLKTRNIATGVRTAFNREGINPAWAPTGTRLAYIKGNPGPIYTAEYDGSDDRLVAQGIFAGPLSWSPDGTFILAVRAATAKYELINVATGATYVIPLAIGPNAVLKPAIR